MYYRLTVCKYKYLSEECVGKRLDGRFQFSRWYHVCSTFSVDDDSAENQLQVDIKLYFNAVTETKGKSNGI